MNEMSENMGFLRVLVLGLLVVALIGPWVFDQINVPAQYPCSAPFIRLEGDFCGTPLSGTWLLFSPFALLLLPIISTAALLFSEYRRGLVMFQIVAFGLALGLVLLSGLFREASQYGVLWGVWLYVGVIAAALVLEGVVWVRRTGAGMG